MVIHNIKAIRTQDSQVIFVFPFHRLPTGKDFTYVIPINEKRNQDFNKQIIKAYEQEYLAYLGKKTNTDATPLL